MQLEMDEDLKSVAEYMQRTVTASKLVPVAKALAAIAPSLWQQDELSALRLIEAQFASEPKASTQ